MVAIWSRDLPPLSTRQVRRAARARSMGDPPRLMIRGQQIFYPDSKPAVLRGMNVMFELDSEFAFPRADTDDLLFELLPGTNLLRLVMLRWDDRPTRAKNGNGNDCTEGNIHTGRSISTRCIEQFKDILAWYGPNAQMPHAPCPMPNAPCPMPNKTWAAPR